MIVTSPDFAKPTLLHATARPSRAVLIIAGYMVGLLLGFSLL
jgi:hypothetical protein